MEVSSHGLALQRVVGCAFDVGIFTNFSQDHLDFHGTMGEYWSAKMLLFRDIAWASLPFKPFTAMVNVDCGFGRGLVRTWVSGYEFSSYAIDRAGADLRAQNVRVTADRIQFDIDADVDGNGGVPFDVPLTGRFNVYNALAAIAVGKAKGIPLAAMQNALVGVTRPAGRMEFIEEGQGFLVVVDYAHTPEGLENVLKVLREFVATDRNMLICVFGCGGDRDAGKRPKMGAMAASLADMVVITSDNPRSEDPERIVEEIRVGASGEKRAKEGNVVVKVEVDRRRAVEYTLGVATPGDVVVLAGKGHESYQVLKDGPVHFDDREVAREVLTALMAE
ncbi:hypothetical protein TWF696_005895 [Orbilia brochopaga]|uniref:Uncharacterized protein n=1 Tax=Orbilia brochopaga TaxID=3140254 RepID=A0AAV9UXW5_9PEZI